MLVDSGGEVAGELLAWYDAHARSLPWRAPPGTPPPDPYRVWLSEIMLQQTTVAAVKPYFANFLARWPDVAALAAADEAEVMSAWAGLGYYARARNLIACARAVALAGGFPDEEEGLRHLPGVGAYTAAAIAAIAFDRRAVVVDANVERVVARLFAVEQPLPQARPQIRTFADRITPQSRAGDFAQAMMDLGSAICTPRAPACLACPLSSACAAYASGAPADFPRKAAKAPKPTRRGTVFWLEREGAVLLVRRPDKGMLGGMRALPSGPWTTDDPGLADAPAPADWRIVGHGRHVFTHFALDYAVAAAKGDAEGEWWPIENIAKAGLPTLFARAADRAMANSPLPLAGGGGGGHGVLAMADLPSPNPSRQRERLALIPGFTGSPLDRAEPVRHDPEALARLARHPDARLLDITDFHPAIDGDALAWRHLPELPSEELALLGLADGAPFFARIDPAATAARRTPELMALFDILSRSEAATYAGARSLLDWHVRHRFCANCGKPTAPIRAGWARKCPACSTEHFPRTDPVVIMLGEHDDKVLIGRQGAFPPGRYSALAGFVEVGESVEEAVARELHEEAGVSATSVRYVMSQPWPFPSQLMLACVAPVADPTIILDEAELEDAKWVTRDQVRAALAREEGAAFLPPPRYAIAHTLFEAWLAGA